MNTTTTKPTGSAPDIPDFVLEMFTNALLAIAEKHRSRLGALRMYGPTRAALEYPHSEDLERPVVQKVLDVARTNGLDGKDLVRAARIAGFDWRPGAKGSWRALREASAYSGVLSGWRFGAFSEALRHLSRDQAAT